MRTNLCIETYLTYSWIFLSASLAQSAYPILLSTRLQEILFYLSSIYLSLMQESELCRYLTRSIALDLYSLESCLCWFSLWALSVQCCFQRQLTIANLGATNTKLSESQCGDSRENTSQKLFSMPLSSSDTSEQSFSPKSIFSHFSAMPTLVSFATRDGFF